MIGKTISHYNITAKLGAGGMGEVYLADDTKLNRQVALKFLPSTLWDEEGAQKRLLREAQAASKLDHPNIVTIHGIDEFEGQPFIIMAHVPGATLREYCKAETRTVQSLMGIAIQIADGLQHAHDAGVIHRDLKPSNVLVDPTGRARILDFGIASLRGAARLTQTGTTVGTLAYAAPELALGREASAATDVYSLGVVMYEMLTGQLPFEGEHEAAIVYSILNEEPKPITTLNATLPVQLDTVVMRCLAKSQGGRFASCADLTDALRQALSAKDSGNSEGAETKPSIAVLPFTNMSADPDNEYFSDGLTEELLNVLASNPGLKVTGRTSCFAFKGKHEDLRSIGQKLGVETLLEGSVRKAGNRVRITTQLVKVSDGFHLWTKTFDRVLDDIFAVQDEIAQSVSEAMDVALLGRPKVEALPKANAKTYNLVLQANHFLSRNSKAAMEKAVELYSQVLAIEPDNARAWEGIARARVAQGGYGFSGVVESYEGAREAALKALEIDDTLAEAHTTVGWVHMSYDFDWDTAKRRFQRAHELAPRNPRTLLGLAYHEHTVGLLEDALSHTTEAVEVDPLNSFAYISMARAYMGLGRYEEAIVACRKAVELSPGHTSGHATLGGLLALIGQFDEAEEAAMKEESVGYRACGLAIVYHLMGDKARSDEQLALLEAQGEQWGIQIVMAHACRGDHDQAFAWLERAYELRDPGMTVCKGTPFFFGLRDDPRWEPFLKKIGLEVSVGRPDAS